MKYGIREYDPETTKAYKIYLGVIGGLVGLSILVLGAITSSILSLPVVGGILILGVLPANIVLTTIAVKNAKVERVREEFVSTTYEVDGKLYREGFMAIGDEFVERIPPHVIAERVNGELVYIRPELDPNKKDNNNVVKFDSIKPIDHSMDGASMGTDKGISRKRVVEFNPKVDK